VIEGMVAGAGFEPATAPREAHPAPSLGYEFEAIACALLSILYLPSLSLFFYF
jgi:hypothetical protein